LLVMDEAHHAAANSWGRVIAAMPEAFVPTAFLVLIRVMGTFCGPRQESRGKILHFREVSSL
jgi:hypothetical protein